MEPEQQPPQGPDPYRSVWNMTPVGGTDGDRRRTELRILPGLLAALVVFLPFGILAGSLWGWWTDFDSATGGWVVTLIGLAGAFSMGAFVASDRT